MSLQRTPGVSPWEFTPNIVDTHIVGGDAMAKTMTSIRLDMQLADEAMKVLGIKNRTSGSC